MPKKEVSSLLKELPNSPGVYKFRDEEGTLLYVGKAKNLKNRVRSYFQTQKNRAKRTESLVSKIANIEWIEVSSDLEALILETNLIKEFLPKYNVLMKDDKNYVYIKISKNEDFPRIDLVRRIEKDGARYFGPKTSAGKAKKTLLLLQKLFMYRSCDLEIKWENEQSKVTKKTMAYPCLDYHIKRCAAPCIGKIDPKTYGESIRKIELFLEGKTDEIEQLLKSQMQEAVAKKEFEKAALLRDKLFSIEELMEKQLVSAPTEESMDVFAFVLDSGKAYFNLFMVRSGKLINQENFLVKAPGFLEGEEEGATELLESFLFQYYERAADFPKQILLPFALEKESFFEGWIRQKVDSVVQIKVPQRGKKNQLLELAFQNALSFRKQHEARWAGFETQDDQAVLEELAAHLELPLPPKRIECFDISHLGGTDTVASMVVFENGKAKKSDYRRFHLKGVEEGEIDDFKSMEEILFRRLGHLKGSLGPCTFKKIQNSIVAFEGKTKIATLDFSLDKEGRAALLPMTESVEFREALFKAFLEKVKVKRVYAPDEQFYIDLGFEQVKQTPKHFEELFKGSSVVAFDPAKHADASFQSRPDLIVIDGGKGQLGAALKAREARGLNIVMIGLAKREEDVFVEGKSFPLLIPKDSKALYLLRRLRDEAHRFAIEFQRSLRGRHLQASVLDTISGVGKNLKMKLLQKYGSVEEIKKSSQQDLEAFVGVSLAKKIRERLI